MLGNMFPCPKGGGAWTALLGVKAVRKDLDCNGCEVRGGQRRGYVLCGTFDDPCCVVLGSCCARNRTSL